VLDAQNAWFGAVRTEQIDRRHEREQSFWDEAIRSVIDGGAAMPDRTRSARPNPNDDRSAAWRSTWDRHDDAMIPVGMVRDEVLGPQGAVRGVRSCKEDWEHRAGRQ